MENHKLIIGNGKKVIVFLHGLGTGKEMWLNEANQLVERHPEYCALLIDLPNQNGNNFDDFMDLEEAAKYVAKLVSEYNFSEVSIIGFSYGGLVASRITNETLPNLQNLFLWTPPMYGVSLLTKLIIYFSLLIPDKSISTTIPNLLSKLGKVSRFKFSEHELKAISRFNLKFMKDFNRDLGNYKYEPNDRISFIIFDDKDPLVPFRKFKKHSAGLAMFTDIKIISFGGHFGKKEMWNNAYKQIVGNITI